MINIRNYIEETDAEKVGLLIAETYRRYNLDFASPNEKISVHHLRLVPVQLQKS